MHEVSDERVFQLIAAGMVAELEMRSAIASSDHEAMLDWIRRSGEVRAHLRYLYEAVSEVPPDSALGEVAQSVLTGLAGTFTTLVTRQGGSALRRIAK